MFFRLCWLRERMDHQHFDQGLLRQVRLLKEPTSISSQLMRQDAAKHHQAACARSKPSSDRIGRTRGHSASNFLIRFISIRVRQWQHRHSNQQAPAASVSFQTSLQKSALFSLSFHLDRWTAVLKVSPTLKTLCNVTVFSGSLILNSLVRLVVNIIDHLRTLLSSSGSRWNSAAFDWSRICAWWTHLLDFWGRSTPLFTDWTPRSKKYKSSPDIVTKWRSWHRRFNVSYQWWLFCLFSVFGGK